MDSGTDRAVCDPDPRGLAEATAKMRAAGATPESVRAFERNYRTLVGGFDGTVPEADIVPVDRPPRVGAPPPGRGTALGKTACVRLNGGLGTSMGTPGAKTAVVAKDGLTFLDILARQVLALRARADAALPLVLMNSFHTRRQSSAILDGYPELSTPGLPVDVVQSAVPKLLKSDLRPATWHDPALEWCPPGHGELFALLTSTGLLRTLLDRGYRYLFVANADNLGAVPSVAMAEHFAASGAPFLMEVCRRTEADRKGGHVARRVRDGRLVLRDSNMVAHGDEPDFLDIGKHGFFNTGNLWFDLPALAHRLAENEGTMPLPLIVNTKTLDPTLDTSPAVLQLETGMGSVIELYPDSQVVEVDRERFIPVKTTNDLLLLRSDFYTLRGSDFTLARGGDTQPIVTLDTRAYGALTDFEGLFPHGAPGLRRCRRLSIKGEIVFGADVTCVGDVELEASGRAVVPDGTTLGEGVHSM